MNLEVMTREEEIRSAGLRICFPSESTIAFKKGAEWADNNPKNPWISVDDDLPTNHKELIHSYCYTVPVLVRCNDSRHHIIRMYRLNDKDWGWIDYAKSITHWMPIPKL